MAEKQGNDKVSEPSRSNSAEMDKTLLLARIYHGQGRQGSGAFRGPTALFKEARRLGHTHISMSDCHDFLRTQPTYGLYRPARKKYKRNRIMTQFCGEVVQLDIMDMQWVKEENDGYLYALISYDTYCKYLSSFPLRNRKPESVIEGLEDLVENLPFAILNIYWDKEGSFLSKRVQSWLKEHEISNYTTTSQVKAPNVERIIRTIRLACSRYFESTNTRRWIDFLPKFVDSYNDREHSTTKRRPLDLAMDPMLTPSTPRIKKTETARLPPIGSLVRLNLHRGVFGKESRGTWSKEVFRVIQHRTALPIPMIYIEDLMGEPISGGLYPQEYQSVEWDGIRKVAQVLKTRTRKGIKEYLVSYDGWAPKFNEWITDPQI